MPRQPTHARPLAAQVPPEVLEQLLRALVAVRRTLLEEPRHDDLEVPAQAPVHTPERRRDLAPDHHRRVRQRLKRQVVRQLSAQRLVQHHAEAVEVAPRVRQLRPGDLLRRHVRQRADHRALRRAARALRSCAIAAEPQHHRQRPQRVERRIRVPRHRRHAEVEDLRVTLRRHQDVARLQVAVRDPARMRVRHRLHDLREERHDLPRRPLRRAAPLRQRLPVHELHHEVRVRRHPRAVGARVEDLRDPRVRQVAEQLDLLPEATERAAAPRADPEHLDRHRVARPRADALQHHAASALTEQARHLVLPHHRRDLERRVRLVDRAGDIDDAAHRVARVPVGVEHVEHLPLDLLRRMLPHPIARVRLGQVANRIEQRRHLAVAGGSALSIGWAPGVLHRRTGGRLHDLLNRIGTVRPQSEGLDGPLWPA
jgi:hypothetical protein